MNNDQIKTLQSTLMCFYTLQSITMQYKHKISSETLQTFRGWGGGRKQKYFSFSLFLKAAVLLAHSSNVSEINLKYTFLDCSQVLLL